MQKAVRVRFSDDRQEGMNANGNDLDHRTYDYFLVGDLDEVTEDDFAVVNVSGRLKIAKVTKVFPNGSSKATKHIVALFNMETSRQIIARQEEISELKAAIEARITKTSWVQKVTQMFEADEEGKKLLARLSELEG